MPSLPSVTTNDLNTLFGKSAVDAVLTRLGATQDTTNPFVLNQARSALQLDRGLAGQPLAPLVPTPSMTAQAASNPTPAPANGPSQNTQQLNQMATPGGISAADFLSGAGAIPAPAPAADGQPPNPYIQAAAALYNQPQAATPDWIGMLKASPTAAPHLAAGGDVPWFVRREAAGEDFQQHGLFNAPSPGRTDTLNKTVPAGSYVIPADVVSGLGEGNTMAGANVLDRMLSTGPFGTKLPSARHGSSIPRPPRPESFAKGGGVPVVVAGGEYLVHPDAVKKVGGGDLKRGHDALDAFVKHVRAKTAKTLKKLPGPKK